MVAGGAVAAAAPGAAAGAAGADGGGGTDWPAILQHVVRTMGMLMLVNHLMRTFVGDPAASQYQSSSSSSSSSSSGSSSYYGDTHVRQGLYRGPLHLLWRQHTPMDLRVYVSTDPAFDYARDHPGKLLWEETGLAFDWSEGNSRERQLKLTMAEYPELARNGSAFAHVLFTRTDFPFNASEPHLHVYKRIQLNKYKRRPKDKKLKALLGGDKDKESKEGEGTEDSAAAATDAHAAADATEQQEKPEKEEGPVIISHWKPALSLHLVHHFDAWPRAAQLPPHIVQQMEIEQDTGLLYPIVYPNEFWLLNEHLIPLNDTVRELPLHLSYSPVGFFKWQIQTQLEQQFHAQQSAGFSEEGESDTVKRMFLETNPILLGITVIVSCLHMLFDMLAFKSDVAFWRQAKSMEGLSLRTIVVNTFFQLVIFLYLLDNDTSWMVLFSSGLGLLIDIWKVQKGLVSSLTWHDPATGARYWVPRVSFSAVESYAGNKTKQYDEEATSHLMYVVVPLMVGYASYSLVHDRHKSWYSWGVTSLTGFVYVFGFVMMTPQLYINYKLKSVAHLPWRTMVYKALNTFIDDLFAFIIKMPTMHRLSCFRDDVIFFIMLYQRYIYPVDKRRVNEFGQLTDENKDSAEAQELLAQVAAAASDDDAAAAAAAAAAALSAVNRTQQEEQPSSSDGVPSLRALAASAVAAAEKAKQEKEKGQEEKEQEQEEEEEEAAAR